MVLVRFFHHTYWLIKPQNKSTVNQGGGKYGVNINDSPDLEKFDDVACAIDAGAFLLSVQPYHGYVQNMFINILFSVTKTSVNFLQDTTFSII